VSSPLISVLLPVRNGGDYLSAAVASILDQSESDLELLLIDDHSSDRAIENLEFGDTRLRVLQNKGQGIVNALNTGLQQARGEFAARMDDDDISLPHRFRAQLDYLLENPDVAIVGGKVEIFSAAGIAGGFRRYQDWINGLTERPDIHREIFIECPLPHPTVFMPRSTLLTLQGYRDRAWAEDYDLLLRADAAGLGMGKPDSVLLHWRDHPDRLSRTESRYANEQFLEAKAHFLSKTRIQGRDVLIWGAGPTGRTLHDALIRQGANILAFLEVHPRRIGGLKRDQPVLHFERVSEYPDALVLVAVGVPSARDEIRSYLLDVGMVEGESFVFVA